MIRFTSIVALAEVAPYAAIPDITGEGDILVLAPHPDDESLAMGGAIAAADQAGHSVHVAVVTDGALSHPRSPSHPGPILAALRRTEVTEAVSVLTARRSTPIWLDYPDQAAPDTEAEFENVAAALAPILSGVSAIWTTWDGDPHIDHQRVWQLSRWIARRYDWIRMFGCPVWGRVQGPVPGAASDGLVRFRTGPFRDLKARAIAAHASQMTDLIDDDPDGFRMPEDLAARSRELSERYAVSDEQPDLVEVQQRLLLSRWILTHSNFLSTAAFQQASLASLVNWFLASSKCMKGDGSFSMWVVACSSILGSTFMCSEEPW